MPSLPDWYESRKWRPLLAPRTPESRPGIIAAKFAAPYRKEGTKAGRHLTPPVALPINLKPSEGELKNRQSHKFLVNVSIHRENRV